jgi:hypothetical protein
LSAPTFDKQPSKESQKWAKKKKVKKKKKKKKVLPPQLDGD